MTPIAIGTKVRMVEGVSQARLNELAGAPCHSHVPCLGEEVWVRSYFHFPASRNYPESYRYLVARSLTAELPKDEVIVSFAESPGMAWVDADCIEVVPEGLPK